MSEAISVRKPDRQRSVQKEKRDLALEQLIGTGGAGFPRGATASALSIQQLTPKRELLLRVAYTCGWTYRMKGKTVELGTLANGELPQVVFNWSKEDHRYTGATDGYDDCCKTLTLEAREEISDY